MTSGDVGGSLHLRVNDAIAGAIAPMVPAESLISHDDLDAAFARFGLGDGDPGRQDAAGKLIGKIRRLKSVLTYAADANPEAGGDLVLYILSRLRGTGAFREGAAYRVPPEMLANAREVLRSEGFNLADDGTVIPLVLDTMSGKEATAALGIYVRRAREGALDAALLAGTAKDLLEATARHVLTERVGGYNEHMPFPGTLMRAVQVIGHPEVTGAEVELRQQLSSNEVERFHQVLFLLAVAVNDLRNAQGTGHGRPFPPTLSECDARTATEAMGLVAGWLLDSL